MQARECGQGSHHTREGKRTGSIASTDVGVRSSPVTHHGPELGCFIHSRGEAGRASADTCSGRQGRFVKGLQEQRTQQSLLHLPWRGLCPEAALALSE